jgi:hypothetical protein
MLLFGEDINNMRWIDYREALGIGFSDIDKTKMLASKIDVMFDYIDAAGIQNEENVCRKYFSYVGERNPGMYYILYQVQENILNNKDILGLISHTIAFSNAAKMVGMGQLGDYILKNLEVYLEDLKLDYEIIQDNDGCFIFPKGAKELDEANINIPFEWLREYPMARRSMENALRSYSNMESPSFVADQFRKALETFAQEFFGKTSSLENLKGVIGKFLKNQGVPKELAGNFETVLQMYTNYMNNYAKHHDKTEREYLEFIMYQTGNIIRFIISLSNDSSR